MKAQNASGHEPKSTPTACRSNRAHGSRKKGPSAAQRAEAIYDLLDKAYPDAGPELKFANAFQLLVAVVLSAQCTDARVNLVTPTLFRRFPSPQSLAEADQSELEGIIRSCGLYRNKAKNLVALSKAIVLCHGGQVPLSRKELSELPGAGVKTAGVVSMHLGGDLAFPVDTHVQRLATRMGLSSESVPEKTEAKLQAAFPKERWYRGHHLLIWHGRRHCTARSPDCGTCVLKDVCPKIGVGGLTKPEAKPTRRTAVKAKA